MVERKKRKPFPSWHGNSQLLQLGRQAIEKVLFSLLSKRRIAIGEDRDAAAYIL